MHTLKNEEVAALFSTGKFAEVHDRIADNASWIVIEENNFIGKDAIVQHCKQVASYFDSVSCIFKIHRIIANAKEVVVEGTAEFRNDKNETSFISACDLYTFNDNKQIESIRSYCITRK